MKILFYVLAGLCLFAVVVTAIGYALPQGHVATREATFSAPPAAVFSTIADVTSQPSWRTGITRVDVQSREPLKWREYEGSDAITFEVVESRPPALLRVRIADPDLPFGGTWTYEVSPEAAGSRLRITENGEVYNPLFRFMSRFVFGHTATIDRYLADLQRRQP
ncbi:MAG: SRPBCC family protein [Vicinamibacterales bacterium]